MANNTVEIILKAIDNASEVFKSIGSSAESAASEIESSIGGVDAFDKLADDVDEFGHEVDDSLSRMDEMIALLDEVYSDDFDEMANDAKKAVSNIETLGAASSTFMKIREEAESAGTAIRTKLGEAADVVKSKFSTMGSSVKGALSNLNYATQEATASFGFLRDAAAMSVGMIGYDLVFSFIEAGRAAINAQGQLDYFANRLGMTEAQISSFNSYLQEMQSEFRKVDMTAVGAAAEEMAVKLQLPIDCLEELTEVTAVLSSAFVKEGRTQEDAIMAVSDALDGQFKRLQELGITQDILMQNGWNGDLNDKKSLLDAINKSLDEMGFTDTAKDITSLDEAFAALGVAGGQLLASVLIPLTPALVAVMEAAMTAFDGIGTVITGLQSAFGAMPDWAQYGVGITAFGIAAGLLGTILISEVVPGMVASAIATMNWIATALGAKVSAITLTGAFSLLGTTIWEALLPLLPYIAVAAAIAVAIYEVGKAFGWWTDVGSMLEAIGAGLQRLWNAFINHPDVQATIQAISDALQTLGAWITQAGQAVLEFFGINESGEFDIVRALIDAIGIAWQMITFPIRTVIQIIQFLVGVFQNVNSTLSDWGIGLEVLLGPIGWVIAGIKALTGALGGSGGGLGGALGTLGEVFGTVWSTIASLVNGVIGPLKDMIGDLITTFTELWNGQITLGEAMGQIWTTISENIGEILNNISETVVNFALTVGEWALQAGTAFFTNLWNTFSQVPGMIYGFLTDAWNWITTVGVQWAMSGLQAAANFLLNVNSQMMLLPLRVGQYLLQVASRILSAGATWVSNAISKASQVVQGVISQVSQLPQKVYNEFIKIATRIRDSISAAVRAATQFGSDIVNAVLGALGIASPGTVQRKTTKEFQDTISNILGLGSDAYRAGQSYGESIVDGFEGVDLNSGLATDLNSGALFDISTGQSYDVDTTQHIDGEIKVVHDLENVPGNLDEAQIAELINQSTSNDDFMKRIAESVSFQRYDSREKLRIKRRNGRDLGV